VILYTLSMEDCKILLMHMDGNINLIKVDFLAEILNNIINFHLQNLPT